MFNALLKFRKISGMVESHNNPKTSINHSDSYLDDLSVAEHRDRVYYSYT